MTTKWIEPPNREISEELYSALGGHPLVSQVLIERGIKSIQEAKAFLDPACYQPAPASELPDMAIAVSRLESAVKQGEKICVWGDFDVDGQTSTALLVEILLTLGADVFHYIPLREKESHGIKPGSLKLILENQKVDVLLTCDTGIAEFEAVDYAQSCGVDVIVTDHHSLPQNLPNAFAVINPQRLPKTHPLHTLPGVGTAYKLAEALCQQINQPEIVFNQLDLVALGIVADVAVLWGDTRYLLQRGLATLQNTPRLGLRALMANAELNPSKITEEHISFVIAPRLNALGRLSDANIAVEFLTTADLSRANIIAQQLEGLNAQRKLLTNQIFRAAQNQIEREPSLLDDYSALVLSHPDWPTGIIGIVASRLVEYYNRPTILLSTPKDGPARGSARSVEGCNITAAISDHQDMLIGFGGHPMAAGLAIESNRIPEFREAISSSVSTRLGKSPSEKMLTIDGYISLENITTDLVNELERLAPFGQGNPPVTLASRNLILRSKREIGREKEHLLLTVEDENANLQKVLWWQGVGWPLPDGPFDLAYHLRASNYKGYAEVQVEWVDFKPAQATFFPEIKKKTILDILDYRRSSNPKQLLKEYQTRSSVQIWAEGPHSSSIPGSRLRHELEIRDTLVIWTLPPDPKTLQKTLARTGAELIVLFAQNLAILSADLFLKQLAGLLKFAIRNYGGVVSLEHLAGKLASREDSIKIGIQWLGAKGLFIIESLNDDIAAITIGKGEISKDISLLTDQLQASLKETSSYRAYFLRADKEVLFNFDG